MKLTPQQRQEAARDREILELNLSEMPAKISDTTKLHQPKARMFSERFITFIVTGLLMSGVFLAIKYWHVKGGWPW